MLKYSNVLYHAASVTFYRFAYRLQNCNWWFCTFENALQLEHVAYGFRSCMLLSVFCSRWSHTAGSVVSRVELETQADRSVPIGARMTGRENEWQGKLYVCAVCEDDVLRLNVRAQYVVSAPPVRRLASTQRQRHEAGPNGRYRVVLWPRPQHCAAPRKRVHDPHVNARRLNWPSSAQICQKPTRTII